MKKIIYIVVLIFLLTLTGCNVNDFFPKHKEISEIYITNVFGIDKGMDDPNDVRVTLVAKKEDDGTQRKQENSEGNSTERSLKASFISAEDKTLSGAVSKLQTYISKELFWGFVEIYLVGAEAAEDGIVEYLDYIMRNYGFRLNSLFYIVEGSVFDFIENNVLSEYLFTSYLGDLARNSWLLSDSYQLTFLKLTSQIDQNDTFAIAIPTLKIPAIQDEPDKSLIQVAPQIDMAGYAILKDYKLVDFVGAYAATGYNIVMNIVGNYIIQIPLMATSEYVSIDVTESYTKIVPVFEDGKLKKVILRNKTTASVEELRSRENIFTNQTLEDIEHKCEEDIKSRILECVNEGKRLEADFLGIGKRLKAFHPILWEQYEDDWPQVFSNLDIEIDINVKISRTSDVTEPNAMKVEER